MLLELNCAFLSVFCMFSMLVCVCVYVYLCVFVRMSATSEIPSVHLLDCNNEKSPRHKYMYDYLSNEANHIDE